MTGTYTALPGDIRRRRRDQHTTAEFSAFKPPPKSKGIEKIIVDELQNHNFRLEWETCIDVPFLTQSRDEMFIAWICLNMID